MDVDALAFLNLEAIRAAGIRRVIRRLEVLINLDVIGLAGAQKICWDAFGWRLKAVKDRSPEFRARLEREVQPCE